MGFRPHCIFIHFRLRFCIFMYFLHKLSRTRASVPRPPAPTASRLSSIETGYLREDGARRPSSYYDIPCLHVPFLSRTVASVPRPPTPNASRPPTSNVSRPPSPSVPVLSSSPSFSLLLTNIKNQWLRVINVCKVWRTDVFFLFLCDNVKCICEIMHNTQRKNSHNILTY